MHHPENKLLSIVNDKDKKWVEHFPPMITKQYCAAAVTTKQHLIVVGGRSGQLNRLNTVEVMDIPILVWSTAASLPHPYTCVGVYNSTCAAVSGELVAVGGEDDRYWSTAAVHKHNPTTNSWDLISNMPTARYDCLVAVLPLSLIHI